MLKRILTTLTLSLFSFGALADVICNNAEISITRGSAYAWGGQESFFQTIDPKIQKYLGSTTSIKGYLLQARYKKIEGEFEYVQNDWHLQVPGRSITLKQLKTDASNYKVVELKVRRSPMVGCIEYRTISGCYAGDDCVQECVSRINIPESILFKTNIICEEI